MSLPEGILRPLDSEEVICESGNKLGNLIVAYTLSLNCRKPLELADVEEALKWLHRKTPNLNLCIKEYEKRLYFFQRKDSDIDFKVKEGQNVTDVVDEIIETPINSEIGPLWLARLLLPAQKSADPYPHTYTMVLGFNHVITDSHSTFTICSYFLKILNDVIAKVPITEEIAGEWADGTSIQELKDDKAIELATNESLNQEITERFKFFSNRTSVFHRIHPPNNNIRNRTGRIIWQLDEATNTKLKAIFKSKGVSFHCGFFALVNWCIVQLLKNHGIQLEDHLEISSLHDLNMRRYLPLPKTFGSQISTIRESIQIPTDDSMNIWDHAKTFHNDMKKSLDGLLFLLDSTFADKQKSPDLCTWPKPTKAAIDYSTTNMTDITSLFNGNGDHVQVDWVTRTSSIHGLDIAVIFILQTFRKKLICSTDFATRYVSEELVEQLVLLLRSKIQDVVRTGN